MSFNGGKETAGGMSNHAYIEKLGRKNEIGDGVVLLGTSNGNIPIKCNLHDNSPLILVGNQDDDHVPIIDLIRMGLGTSCNQSRVIYLHRLGKESERLSKIASVVRGIGEEGDDDRYIIEKLSAESEKRGRCRPGLKGDILVVASAKGLAEYDFDIETTLEYLITVGGKFGIFFVLLLNYLEVDNFRKPTRHDLRSWYDNGMKNCPSFAIGNFAMQDQLLVLTQGDSGRYSINRELLDEIIVPELETESIGKVGRGNL